MGLNFLLFLSPSAYYTYTPSAEWSVNPFPETRTLILGQRDRWTRKTGPSCSKMPVVTVKEKEEDGHKAMKAFHSCFCKENNPTSERLRKHLAHHLNGPKDTPQASFKHFPHKAVLPFHFITSKTCLSNFYSNQVRPRLIGSTDIHSTKNQPPNRNRSGRPGDIFSITARKGIAYYRQAG